MSSVEVFTKNTDYVFILNVGEWTRIIHPEAGHPMTPQSYHCFHWKSHWIAIIRFDRGHGKPDRQLRLLRVIVRLSGSSTYIGMFLCSG